MSGIRYDSNHHVRDEAGGLGAGDMGPGRQVNLVLDDLGMKVLQREGIGAVDVEIEISQLVTE